MTDFKKSAKTANGGSSGGAGLVWLIGTVVSYFSTTAFKVAGWTGVGKAMLVGSGTALGFKILALPGMLLGGLLGAAIGGFAARNGDVAKGAVVGGIVGTIGLGIPAGIYGATEGYSLSRQWLSATTPAVRTIDTPVQAPATTVTIARPAA